MDAMLNTPMMIQLNDASVVLSFAVVSTLTLIMLLIQREISTGVWTPFHSSMQRMARVNVFPLALVFVINLLWRIIEAL